MSALIPTVFYKLCRHFFYEDGTKHKFKIENKSTVVSDPFVDYLDQNVFTNMGHIEHIIAPSHISPDLAFYVNWKENGFDPVGLFGIEVKTSKSKACDINFNSTIPCGNIVVEVEEDEKIIPCYYLFVQFDEVSEENNEFEIAKMMLVDGDFINSDFDLYLEATGIREKKINIGSYGDGMDKQRQMFMFPNPLRISGIRSERSTLITKIDFEKKDTIGKVATIERGEQVFFAYQAIRNLVIPLDNVQRSEKTRPRNKLKIKNNE